MIYYSQRAAYAGQHSYQEVIVMPAMTSPPDLLPNNIYTSKSSKIYYKKFDDYDRIQLNKTHTK